MTNAVAPVLKAEPKRKKRILAAGNKSIWKRDAALSLMDALFYWLQMRLVCDSSPDDAAARETVLFFAQILSEDHGLASYDVSSQDEVKIYVTYRTLEGSERTVWFDRESAEHMVNNPILSREERERNAKEEGQS
jgi:hypothetical protein